MAWNKSLEQTGKQKISTFLDPECWDERNILLGLKHTFCCLVFVFKCLDSFGCSLLAGKACLELPKPLLFIYPPYSGTRGQSLQLWKNIFSNLIGLLAFSDTSWVPILHVCELKFPWMSMIHQDGSSWPTHIPGNDKEEGADRWNLGCLFSQKKNESWISSQHCSGRHSLTDSPKVWRLWWQPGHPSTSLGWYTKSRRKYFRLC